MDIDKRTGRGCVWSILSKTIARKLVDDSVEKRPWAIAKGLLF